MSERRPPPNDMPSKDAPPVDPPREALTVEAPGAPVEPSEADAGKPTPAERVQKLRLGVRLVWWSAVVLTVCFGGVAVWMGVGQRDPFALVFVALAACCAIAGYGTLIAVRRPSAS